MACSYPSIKDIYETPIDLRSSLIESPCSTAYFKAFKSDYFSNKGTIATMIWPIGYFLSGFLNLKALDLFLRANY